MSIKVNTDLVAQTGNAIEIKNQQIRNYFNDVESAVRKLQANWQGAAADRAMEVPSCFSRTEILTGESYGIY